MSKEENPGGGVVFHNGGYLSIGLKEGDFPQHIDSDIKEQYLGGAEVISTKCNHCNADLEIPRTALEIILTGSINEDEKGQLLQRLGRENSWKEFYFSRIVGSMCNFYCNGRHYLLYTED